MDLKELCVQRLLRRLRFFKIGCSTHASSTKSHHLWFQNCLFLILQYKIKWMGYFLGTSQLCQLFQQAWSFSVVFYVHQLICYHGIVYCTAFVFQSYHRIRPCFIEAIVFGHRNVFINWKHLWFSLHTVQYTKPRCWCKIACTKNVFYEKAIFLLASPAIIQGKKPHEIWSPWKGI
jgi:hypothetical protein